MHLLTDLRTALMSNALFTRLAIAYGMKERLLIYPPPSQLRDRDFRKVLADSYEAYLGLVWRDIKTGKRPLSDLSDYFVKLFDPSVFPDLDKEIKRWQDIRDNRRRSIEGQEFVYVPKRRRMHYEDANIPTTAAGSPQPLEKSVSLHSP